MKLSISIIVKNEEACFKKCLESIKDADEIIVVDTGSTDKTIEIAKKYTDKIYHFDWCDDFAKARNFSLSKCTGDWVLIIDADQQLLTPIKKVKEEIAKASGKSLFIKSHCGKNWHYSAILFKREPNIFWVGKVHESINVVTTQVSKVERNCDYSINHSLDKERNLKILLTMEKTSRTLFYLGKEYCGVGKYEEAIKSFDEYLKIATWLDEKAEAYYYKALSQWRLKQGKEARKTIFEAIKLNPDMKKALVLCSQMHYEPWKSKWLNLSKACKNKNVIFN